METKVDSTGEFDLWFCGEACGPDYGPFNACGHYELRDVNATPYFIPDTPKVECDDVCEWLGGPPTKWELFRADLKVNVIAPIRRFLKSILYINYRGKYRPDGYKEYSWFIAIYIFNKQVFFHYGG